MLCKRNKISVLVTIYFITDTNVLKCGANYIVCDVCIGLSLCVLS